MAAAPPPGGRRRGVLFDVDGTLIDSSYLHTLSWWGAFRQYGYDVPMANIHHFVGMGGARLVDNLLPDGRDRSEDEDIMASHGALYASHWPSLRAFDGVKDLLGQCHAGGLAVALASSAREKDLQVSSADLDVIRANVPGADVRTYDDDPTKFADLNNGRTDAILIDRLAALEYAKKAPKTVAAGEAFSRQESGIALRKGEPELLAAVNKALDDLRADGTLKKLSEKYFNADVTK